MQKIQRSKPIRVEDAIGIDDSRLWYCIPNFNGYEISNDGYIRSLKHFKKYPFGMLIRPKQEFDRYSMKWVIVGDPDDPTFELSNDENERILKRRSELWELAMSYADKAAGYPRKTIITDTGTRNQKIFSKKPPESSLNDKIKNISGFKIRAVENEYDKLSETSSFKIFKQTTTPICPIESINGGKYYGRKDS